MNADPDYEEFCIRIRIYDRRQLVALLFRFAPIRVYPRPNKNFRIVASRAGFPARFSR